MTGTTKAVFNFFPASKHFNIDDFPFYWLSCLDSQYSQEMEKTLKKIGLDSSRWQVCMLLRIYETLSVSQIANDTITKVPTTTKIIQRMEHEGLVSTHKDQTDARIKNVSLTPLGKEKIKIILQVTKPLFDKAFDNISEQEVYLFIQTAKKILRNLDNDYQRLALEQ